MSYLELIVGHMFSGKTSELIRLYKEKINNNKNVFAINYDKDIRYGNNKIISHDKNYINSINMNALFEINKNDELKEKFKAAEWIFINEAQFFKDLKPWIILHLFRSSL